MQRIVLDGSDFEDVDVVQQVIAQTWVEHDLRPLGDGDGMTEPRFAMVGVSGIKIAEMAVGAPVEVHTGHEGAYGITTPLEGHLETKFGRELVLSDCERATVNSAGTDLHIPEWSCPVLCVRVDSAFLEEQYERVLAKPFERLPVELDLSSPAGRDWHGLVRATYDHLMVSESDLFDRAVFADQLASTLTTGLLLAASAEEPRDRMGTQPRIVRRVLTAIEADPAHPWTPVELADLAGVSVRRLQQGFREYVGRSPFQHLRDVRLERAHHDLVHADGGETVTDISARWGLFHAGRFSADYRRRYGRAPSETLRR